MKEKKTLEKVGTTSQPEPLTQTPTIRDAVTYIVDEHGNETKVNGERRTMNDEPKKDE